MYFKNSLKKSLVFLAGLILLLSFVSANVYINEFESNPSSGSEWVEIYNDGVSSVDISGWKIYDGLASPSLMYTVPSLTTISANSFYVADVSGLNNGNDFVTLKDDLDVLIDQTPTLADNDDDEKTWQRLPDGTGSFVFKTQTKSITNILGNSIESSTMVFEGSLTDNGDGTYSGTIDAVPGSYYLTGDGCINGNTPDGNACVGGWDVYAKEGGNAYYDDIFQGIIGSDHDAYSHSGGWGAFWNPDVPDWNHYQLTISGDNWYLEYKGSALGTPLLGSIDWIEMYASETGTGSYRGVVPADPDANDGDAVLNGGGPQAWDMDWTWGSEAIPLEYPGFDIEITSMGYGDYRVTLTPAPLPVKPAQLGNEVSITPGSVGPGNEGPDVHMMGRYLDIGIDIDQSGSSINPSDIRNGFYAFTGEKIYYLVLVRDQNGAADIDTVRWTRNGLDETAMCAPMEIQSEDRINTGDDYYVWFNGENVYINHATNLLYDSQLDKAYRCVVEVEPNWDADNVIAVKSTDQSGNSGQTLEEMWNFNPPLTVNVKTSDGRALSFGEKELDQATPGVTSPNCEIGIGENLMNRNCQRYQNLPDGQKLCDVSFSTNKIIIENKGIVDLWPFIAATDFHDSTGMATCPFDNTLSANQFEYRALQGSWDSGWRIMPEYSPNLGCEGPIGSDTCRGACRITEGCPINILGPMQNIQMQLKIVWPTPCIGNFNEGSIYAIVRAV